MRVLNWLTLVLLSRINKTKGRESLSVGFLRDHISWFEQTLGYEYELMHAISARFKVASEVFVDIGANIGVYGIKWADEFDSVVCVEPNPVACQIGRINAELADKKNIEYLQLALSHRRGSSLISIYGDEYGQAQLTDRTDGSDRSRTMECGVETLDDQLAKLGFEDSSLSIKIDVEGHELEVLAGARASLKRTNLIVMEVSPETAREALAVMVPEGEFRFYIPIRSVDDRLSFMPQFIRRILKLFIRFDYRFREIGLSQLADGKKYGVVIVERR